MIRKFFFWTHLILGIAAGVMILVMCLTGVLSAYQRQIQTYLNHRGKGSHRPAPDAKPLPLEVLAGKVRDVARVEPLSLLIPADEGEPVEVDLGNKGVVYVDAFTGVITGRPSPSVFRFFAGVNAWHRAMGVNGRNRRSAVAVMDAANLLCFYLTVAGLFLWLPRKWTWRHIRAVLLFRWHLSSKARDFNWHNVLGFWMLIPLAVMVWTGVALSYRWADRVTLQALGQAERRQGDVAAPAIALAAEPDPFELRVAGVDPLFEKAKTLLTGWKRIEVEIPPSLSSAINFTADLSGYGAPGQSPHVEIDREGDVVSLRKDSLRGRSVYRFAHTGELWGVAGQTIAMLGCVAGMVLVYTGTALSIRRWSAWRTRTKKRTKEKHDAKNDVEDPGRTGIPAWIAMRGR